MSAATVGSERRGLTLLSPSVLLLVAVNLVPLWGVLYAGWDVGTIILLYWLETLIAGLFNIPKVATARGMAKEGTQALPGGVGLALFFVLHFGVFSLVHFVFVSQMFDLPTLDGQMKLALFGLAGSRFVSLTINWFGNKEYLGRTRMGQMMVPYGRLMAMHMMIVFGGWGVARDESVVFPLVLLVCLKIVADVIAHLISHNSVQKTA